MTASVAPPQASTRTNARTPIITLSRAENRECRQPRGRLEKPGPSAQRAWTLPSVPPAADHRIGRDTAGKYDGQRKKPDHHALQHGEPRVYAGHGNARDARAKCA